MIKGFELKFSNHKFTIIILNKFFFVLIKYVNFLSNKNYSLIIKKLFLTLIIIITKETIPNSNLNMKIAS